MFILTAGATGGCAGHPPLEEYSIARAALFAAKEVEAQRYAPGFWYKAEEHYRLGQSAYKNNDFKTAKVNFDQAKEFAEKAENATRLKKFQSGETVQ